MMITTAAASAKPFGRKPAPTLALTTTLKATTRPPTLTLTKALATESSLTANKLVLASQLTSETREHKSSRSCKLDHARSKVAKKINSSRLLPSEIEEQSQQTNNNHHLDHIKKYQMNLQESFKISASTRHLSPFLVWLAASLLIVFLGSSSVTASRVDPSASQERLHQLVNGAHLWDLPLGHHQVRYRSVQPINQQMQAQPSSDQSSQQHLRFIQNQRHHHQQEQQQQQANQQEAAVDDQQVDESQQSFRGVSLVHLLPPNANGDLQPQASQQSPAYWTSDLWPSASNQQQQPQIVPIGTENQNKQFAASGPVNQQQVPSASGSTTPTINRQLIAPPPFYEIGLAPTNAIQIEMATDESQNHHHHQDQGRNLQQQPPPNVNGARQLPLEERFVSHSHRMPRHNGTARSNELFSDSSENQHKQQNAATDSDGASNVNKDDQGGVDKASGIVDQPLIVDKSIEPRQRRRIFNRILKKAEWNHLFVELSKVFLRYFLDLALKDIIGKQSGGGETTTSRKKLDAQSELTDLLKDFVKTAISNI